MKTKGVNEESQRLMNARLWQCIQDNGGVQDFAKSTGLSPQTLYNIRDNRSFPSAGTLKVFTKKVPSFSIGAIFGESDSLDWRGAGIAPAAAINPTPPDTLKAEVKRLETENKELRAELKRAQLATERAQIAAERATKKAFDYADRGFLSSGSQPPMSRLMASGVAQEREPIGFEGVRAKRPTAHPVRPYSAPVQPRRARATGQVGQA